MICFQASSFAQSTDTINEKETGRIIRFLASDSLKGRGNITLDLLKATTFIGDEFKKSRLANLPGSPGYYLSFHPFADNGAFVMDQLQWNGKKVEPARFSYLHVAPGNFRIMSLTDFKVVKSDSYFTNDILQHYSDDTSSLLLWTDQMQPGGSAFIPANIKMPVGGLKRNILLVFSQEAPASISLSGYSSQYLTMEYNVVGILPGRSKADEIVMFSAHYDHIGVNASKGDSILNGANDNASGTTALLQLAQYFAKRNDNERTLMFCAFAGEEIGLLGSTNFSGMVNAEKVVAGINIEMIGLPQYGKNKLMIIGYKYSNLPRMLEKGLKKKGISVRVEPSDSKHLFQRSDNYQFALKGIPYHTLMASDDDDPCYHNPCDEVKRIDIANMTRIIKGIAFAVAPLVKGDVTPSRVIASEVELTDE